MTKLSPSGMPIGHCRYCGKPVHKYTTTVWFKTEPSQYDHPTSGAYSYGPLPQTRADAQRRTNQQVVSVQRTSRGIERATVWDGERYRDAYFCTGEHARLFAHSIAANTRFAMDDWRAATAEAAEDKAWQAAQDKDK